MTITATVGNSANTSVLVSASEKSKVVSATVPGPKGDHGTIIAATSLNLSNLADIDTTALSDGSMLMYSTSTEKWVAQNELETGTIILSGGFF
ncbi:MAG: hypothetical protein HOC66_05870 [Flavobacteriales bacterium]|jgi:hypothetical protein|nr:hypothetical protein [Flavobacteriales bacterium]